MKKIFYSFRFRIVFVTVLCVGIVQIFSNLYIFQLMNMQLTEKSSEIDENLLSVIENTIEARVSEISQVLFLIEEDYTISTAMSFYNLDTSSARQTALKAQDLIDAYFHSITSADYIRKFVLINDSDLMIQSTVAQISGLSSDLEQITALSAYDASATIYDNIPFEQSLQSVEPSLVAGQSVFRVIRTLPTTNTVHATLYLELSTDFILDAIEPYTGENLLFITTEYGDVLSTDSALTLQALGLETAAALQEIEVICYDNVEYSIVQRTMSETGLTVYVGTNIAQTQLSQSQTFTLIIQTILISLLISSVFVYFTSVHFTQSIHNLIRKIKDIGNNDFSFDASIEASNDEISAIGKVLNEMSLSFQNLLDAVIRDSDEKKRVEFALLQSQVNPHFLYNTLDSIRWMADIQGNDGVALASQSLINLLKNMSKGVSEKITLEEELRLLQDYSNIQSIRYVESFTVEHKVPPELLPCKVIKMTLQPLLENAIFHGVQPSGHLGVIVISAEQTAQDWLRISVRDNGVGMTQEEMEALLRENNTTSDTLSKGIGVSNVHKRLRMLYGEQSGITIQSEKGQYTELSIHIPIERTFDV